MLLPLRFFPHNPLNLLLRHPAAVVLDRQNQFFVLYIRVDQDPLLPGQAARQPMVDRVLQDRLQDKTQYQQIFGFLRDIFLHLAVKFPAVLHDPQIILHIAQLVFQKDHILLLMHHVLQHGI